MIIRTEFERFMHFFSKILLVFGLVISIPFIIVAFTEVPLFHAAPDIEPWQRVVIGSILAGGLLLVIFPAIRLFRKKHYIDIDPQTKTITLYRKKTPRKSLSFSDIDHLFIDGVMQSSVDSTSAMKYLTYHIRVPEMDNVSLWDGKGQPAARKKAKELAELMGVGIQSEGGEVREHGEIASTLAEKTEALSPADLRATPPPSDCTLAVQEDEEGYTITGSRKHYGGLVFGLFVFIGAMVSLYWVWIENGFFRRAMNAQWLGENSKFIIVSGIVLLVGLFALFFGIRSFRKKDTIRITSEGISRNRGRKIALTEIEEVKESHYGYPQVLAANDSITVPTTFCPKSDVEYLFAELRRLIRVMLHR